MTRKISINVESHIEFKCKPLKAKFFLVGFCFISLLLFAWIGVAGAVVYIDKDRPGGSGTSWTDAFNSIAAAIAATGESQEFWVAEGTYTPSSDGTFGTRITPKQGSQFYGGFAGNETSRDQRDVNAHLTIIDGEPNSLAHVMLLTINAKDVKIDGFTIKNGAATGDGIGYWDKWGGGIFGDFVDEPGHTTIIANCIFDNNTASESGGAIFISGRVAVIENTVFTNNNSKAGGALGVNDASVGQTTYDAELTISDCTFDSNQADLGLATEQRGGAIWTLNIGQIIQRTTFSGNTAGHLGGAIEINQPQSALLSDCEFTSNQVLNSTGGGGAIAGMWINSGDMPSITMTGCTFLNNSSLLEGGGVYSYYCHMLIQDCRFQGNTAVNGGAVMLDYKIAGANKVSRIERCLFMGNNATSVGGALRSYARSTEVVNSVFGYNSAVDAGAVGFHAGDNSHYDPDFTATLSNCSFYGNSASNYGGAVVNSYVPVLYIYNSIFWGNQGEQEIWDSGQGKNVGTNDVFNAGSSSMTTRYTDMETLNWEHASVTESHAGSFSSNPMFVDPDGADNTQGTLDDNLRLKLGSPCNDHADGDNAPATDIESGMRVDLPGKPNLGTGTPDYGDLGPYETVAGNLSIVPQITILLE